MKLNKRQLIAKSLCHRHQLPMGGIPFKGDASVSDNLFKKLKRIDKDLELIYHIFRKTVECYRVKVYGAVSSDDYLVHQFTLEHKPGAWLVDYLNKIDTWKNETPFTSAQKTIASQEEIEHLKRVHDDIQMSEFNQDIAKEMVKCFTERKVFHIPEKVI